MLEAQPTTRAGNPAGEPLRHRLIERLEQLVTGELAEALQYAQLELAPEHAGEHKQLTGAPRQATDSPRDHPPHTGREPQLGGGVSQ